MRRLHSVLVSVLAVACLVGLAQAPRAQVARHLAAPPDDILAGRVVLPEPAALAVTARHAVLELSWQPDGRGWEALLDLPVERSGPLSLALVGAGAEGWAWELAAPASAAAVGARELRPVEAWVAESGARRLLEPVASGDPRVAVGLELPAADAGSWRLRVHAPTDAMTNEPPAAAWLVARTAGASEVALSSHLDSHRLLTDRAFAVVARLDGAAGPAAGHALVESLAGRSTVVLQDDGLHGDGAAGDGVLGAWVGPLPAGAARVVVQVRAPTSGGGSCVRTAHHAFTVEDPAVLLAGTAVTAVLDAQRLAIEIGLHPFGELRRLHLSAEVWGLDADGGFVPVAWLSHIGAPAETFGGTSLALHLDGRWLARAGTTGPLELREVRVQDPDSHVLFDELAALPLRAGALPEAAFDPPGEVTAEMLLGASPPGAPAGGATLPGGGGVLSPPAGTLSPGGLSQPAGGASAAPGLGAGLVGQALPRFPWKRALMLSHGYCSGGTIWPPADFSQPKLVFLDPDENRTNDEFAQLLAGTGAGKDSFGFVGHSQGGLAALHLLTYYHTGLDFALGPRRIQSVASPYLGTPLASLGFFACGVNDDMTTSGAPTWLSGIPTWARQQVFYWTTQNSGSACNFFTNLILDSPNDGTVERVRGQLAGGNSMGHVSGWCHTTGMSNPANYTDHVRNQQMNALAAR